MSDKEEKCDLNLAFSQVQEQTPVPPLKKFK